MSLHDVLIHELRDLYSAENQLVKALPKSVKGTSDKGMKALLKEHLDETRSQVLRLREAFGHIGKKPTGAHCNGMEGCLKEVTEALEEDETGALKDAGLLGATLRVVHYELAGYTAALAMAKSLGEKEIVALLNDTVKEKTNAAKGLVSAAKPILKAAQEQEPEDEPETDEEEEKEPKDAEEKKSEQESEDDEKEAAPELKGDAATPDSNAPPEKPAKKKKK